MTGVTTAPNRHNCHTLRTHRRSTRITATAIASGRTDHTVRWLGRPGQSGCRLRTGGESHTSSRLNELSVAYSTRNSRTRTPTTTAKPDPAHTRARDERSVCSTIASPSAARHSAVHGAMRGEDESACITFSPPVAQPTQFPAATRRTTETGTFTAQANTLSGCAGGWFGVVGSTSAPSLLSGRAIVMTSVKSLLSDLGCVSMFERLTVRFRTRDRFQDAGPVIPVSHLIPVSQL